MGRIVVAALLLALGAPLHAGDSAVESKDIAGFVPGGFRVISRLDTDVTGDGVADAAFVSINEKEFEATVTVLMRLHGKPLTGKGQMSGFQPVDTLKLDLTPHGPPTLAFRNGVLVVESATGGNTVRTAATYRYRFDADEGRMRLIGIDAERTATTNAIKLSWNLLTGAHLVRRGKRDPAVFTYGPESKSVQKSEKVYMSATPSPDDLIDKLVK
jgi:hypothetical protein